MLAAGAHPVSCATVRLEADGEVDVYVGTTEVGQGARTVMPQIAAEILGLPVDRVRMQGTDTRFTPYDRSTGASRSTTVAGLAVLRAAEDLRAQLAEIAGGEPDPSEYVDLMRRHFGFAGGELIGRAEVASRGLGLVRGGAGLLGGLPSAPPRSRSTRTPASCACAAPRPAPTWAGRSTRGFVERQDEGATLQGIGNGAVRGGALRRAGC